MRLDENGMRPGDRFVMVSLLVSGTCRHRETSDHLPPAGRMRETECGTCVHCLPGWRIARYPWLFLGISNFRGWSEVTTTIKKNPFFHLQLYSKNVSSTNPSLSPHSHLFA